MFKKVMVGVDGETGGRDAIALARELVAADGELIEAHVSPIHPAKFSVAPVIGSDTSTDEPADGHEPGSVTGAGHARRVLATSIGRGLHVLAEREDADLLVVGSTRHGIFGRVMLGNDTRESINGAPCAVAIAPAGYAEHPNSLKSVGVAYNESAESDYAVAVGRGIAAQRGAQLSAMEVVNLPTYAYLAGAGVPLSDITEPMLTDARARIEALGEIVAYASFGTPAEELTQYSGNLGLLIVGARDYGPMGRLIHSSTSRNLARSCRCPLLILTRGARGQDDAESGSELSAAGSVD